MLSKTYQEYLDIKAGISQAASQSESSKINSRTSLNVGIVGGGISGLYSAMLMQKYIPGVTVKLFEASDRVGGRIYTHRFSMEPHQYFEAGAMRIPDCESQAPVFGLIQHLNDEFPDNPMIFSELNLLCQEGNRVLVNNTKQRNGGVMSSEYAAQHCSELGFPDITDSESAGKIFKEALTGVADALKANFETALLKYSHMSIRDYLSKELVWSFQKINYVEVMCAETNFFQVGLIEHFFMVGTFGADMKWKTIHGGMSKLPEACAEAIKKNDGSILLNTKVNSIIQRDKSDVIQIGYCQQKSENFICEDFDAIIITIQPSKFRNILERPHFGVDLEQALRASYYFPCSKMGLRFHSRFWERTDLDLPPSYGGQSLTDLPSRWVIYPDHDIGGSGKGVLTIYNRRDDTEYWCLMSKTEKIKQALHDLQALYPEVDIACEYAGGESQDSDLFLKEAFCKDWSCMMNYYPGQFISYYPSMVRPQGKIYFAGAHLSSTLVWIMSGMESARRAIQLLTLNSYGSTKVDYL